MESLVIFDCNHKKNSEDWKVVNDGVMGGKSRGLFSFNEKGSCIFSGNVSLENNGGFSLLRYRFAKIVAEKYSKITIKIKGDGKRYQIRLRSTITDEHVYVSFFQTINGWETISFDLSTMYPTFRGKKLKRPNYNKSNIEEVAFLIGNKEKEDFRLEINAIILE